MAAYNTRGAQRVPLGSAQCARRRRQNWVSQHGSSSAACMIRHTQPTATTPDNNRHEAKLQPSASQEPQPGHSSVSAARGAARLPAHAVCRHQTAQQQLASSGSVRGSLPAAPCDMCVLCVCVCVPRSHRGCPPTAPRGLQRSTCCGLFHPHPRIRPSCMQPPPHTRLGLAWHQARACATRHMCDLCEQVLRRVIAGPAQARKYLSCVCVTWCVTWHGGRHVCDDAPQHSAHQGAALRTTHMRRC
jgi:hypothetical protein